MHVAKELIDQACKLGVWGVKFQKRDIESIPEDLKKLPRDIDTSFGYTYYEHRKYLELDIGQIIELSEYARQRGLKFGISVFDYVSIDLIRSNIAYFDFVKLGCKGQKKSESIPVSLNRILPDPLDMGEILIEEVTNAGGQFHSFSSCQREKSTICLRLSASVTLRYTLVYLYSL